MKKIQCPRCGAHKYSEELYEKVFICEQCGSCFFVENIAKIKHSIILKKETITVRGKQYKLLGASELHHANGVRTEWQLQDKDNQLYILTEEDENFSLVKNMTCEIKTKLNWNTLRVNTQLDLLQQSWLVTEQIELNFPDCGTLHYCYLTSVNAELLVLIFDGNSIVCRQGFWLDAFEINQ